MQEDMTPFYAHMGQDSKGVKVTNGSIIFFGLSVARCRNVELTTLNIPLLGR